MKKGILLTILIWKSSIVFGQYSFTEFGIMHMNYSRKGPFKDALWPGFSLNIAGFQFSRFAGEVALRDTTGAAIPAGWKPHGSYWNVGYIKNVKPGNKDKEGSGKLPLTNVYYGFLLGNWRTHEGGSFLSLSVPVGGAFNIVPGVSLTTGLEAGMNFESLFGNYVQLDPMVENTRKAFPLFYCNPRVGLRFSYDLLKCIGDISTYYAEPGMRTRYYYQNGYTYYQNYWDEGGTVTSNIGTSEIVCLAPVVFFPRGFDGVGVTRAAGARLTLRYGILASDVQYLQGKIGFRIDAGSAAGSKENQCYWDYQGVNISLGLNVFSWRTPFKQASIIRFILGKRWGVANINPHYIGPNVNLAPNSPELKNAATNNFFMAAEFGRCGVSWDFLKNPSKKYEVTNGLIGAYHMIPLVRAGGGK